MYIKKEVKIDQSAFGFGMFKHSKLRNTTLMSYLVAT